MEYDDLNKYLRGNKIRRGGDNDPAEMTVDEFLDQFTKTGGNTVQEAPAPTNEVPSDPTYHIEDTDESSNDTVKDSADDAQEDDQSDIVGAADDIDGGDEEDDIIDIADPGIIETAADDTTHFMDIMDHIDGGSDQTPSASAGGTPQTPSASAGDTPQTPSASAAFKELITLIDDYYGK